MAASEESTSNSCCGCEMTLKKFLTLTENEAALYEFLFKHDVLPRHKTCECGGEMTLNMETKIFKCYKQITITKPPSKKLVSTCNKEKSLYTETWFERSNLSVSAVCSLVAYWCFWRPPRQVFLKNELKISQKNIYEWNDYLRELCIWEISSTRDFLGGENKVVEFNIAKFGNKRRDSIKLLIGEVVFVAFEHDSENICIVGLPDGSPEELCFVIQDNILPGTIVASNNWSSYKPMQDPNFIDLSRNHNITFADLNSSSVPNIFWREVRVRIPRYGDRKILYAGEMCEFLYRYKYFGNHDWRIHEMFQSIAKWFDPY